MAGPQLSPRCGTPGPWRSRGEVSSGSDTWQCEQATCPSARFAQARCLRAWMRSDGRGQEIRQRQGPPGRSAQKQAANHALDCDAKDHEQASCTTRTPDPVQVAACLLEFFGHAARRRTFSDDAHAPEPEDSITACLPSSPKNPPTAALRSNPIAVGRERQSFPAPPSVVRGTDGGRSGVAQGDACRRTVGTHNHHGALLPPRRSWPER